MELLAELKEVSLETIRFLIISESEEGAMRGLVDVPQQVLTRPLDLKYFFHQVERAFTLRSVIRNPANLKLLGKAESLPALPRVFCRISPEDVDMLSAMVMAASMDEAV